MTAPIPKATLLLCATLAGCAARSEVVAPGKGLDPGFVLSARGGATYPAAQTTAGLGRGFDSLHREVLGNCVAKTKATSLAGDDGSNGATSDLNVYYARTREELSTALGVAAEASATFKFARASARARYAQRDDFTSDTTFLVITSEVVNSTETLESYRLSEEAERILAAGPAAFSQMCGDQFVAARITGGSLYVVLEIQNASSGFARDVSAGAGLDAWLFSASGEITDSARTKLERENVSIRVFQAGGDSHPDDLRALVPYAFRFRSEVTGANAARAAPIAFITKPYGVVPTKAGKEIPSLAGQRRKLTELAEWHGAAKMRRRELINAEAAGGECTGRKRRFSDAVADVEGVIAAIESEARECVDEPTTGCARGNARPLPRNAHLAVIEQCASEHARRGEIAARAKSASEKRRLEARLKEARKGELDGSPCKTWEVRSVRPRWGNSAEWISLTATASAGGSLQAQQSRSLAESTGWTVTPPLSVPAGASLKIEGKESYYVSCGFLNLGSCRKTRIVASTTWNVAPRVEDGSHTERQFTIRLECIESTRGSQSGRATRSGTRRRFRSGRRPQ